ncbi:P-loop NTPase fold protein, partial [Streptomyces acidiscabies]|uniref:P-loop NTPase fold protein n=1 Tax=Streptomyces acidiscabies TaxID=42234 RepID=UPI0038F6D129
MDELLEDIDEVLRNIDYRVIIVIDDLDRLDTKAVNNILFATKQTFKLTRANYIFCYDTEVLTNNKEDDQVAREFLEKFV